MVYAGIHVKEFLTKKDSLLLPFINHFRYSPQEFQSHKHKVQTLWQVIQQGRQTGETRGRTWNNWLCRQRLPGTRKKDRSLFLPRQPQWGIQLFWVMGFQKRRSEGKRRILNRSRCSFPGCQQSNYSYTASPLAPGNERLCYTQRNMTIASKNGQEQKS